MSTLDLAHITAIYVEECGEQLAVLEAALLDLERAPEDREILGAMFRAAHSIKGGAATFGFATIARLTHQMESLLDAMRGGAVVARRPHVDALLCGADLVRTLLRCQAEGTAEPTIDEAIAACIALLPARPQASAAHAPSPEVLAPPVAPALITFEIRFAPAPDTLRVGIDPLMILRDLASLGRVVRGQTHAAQLPTLEAIDPCACALAWVLELETAATAADLRAVFDYVEEGSEISIEPLVPVVAAANPPVIASITPPPPAPEPAPAAAPPAAPATPARPAPRGTGAEPSSTLRVATEKIDKLMDLVGELLVNQSMVTQSIRMFRPERLAALQESCLEMERTTREVQERVMAIRMLPIGTVFGRVPRIVRDLSQQLGKQVEVELVGEDTEVDKGILEQISDPITHLVRNALDHGLEGPDERRRSGKPETGRVRLAAGYAGGAVVLHISDDGRGLDVARIRARAVERGLISADANLCDEQIYELIFEPGFSTAEVVTDVSGRGVGMDVVRRTVQRLHGSLTITSKPGAGSCIRISLPLTLAILDGMCMRVGATTYVLPLTSIVETIRPRPDQLRRVLGAGELVLLRDEEFPLLRLHQLFQIPDATTDPTRGLVVIVEDNGRRVGLLVDDLLGEAQLVAKGLEAHFRRVDGLVGATVLGDGSVALILDLPRLLRLPAAVDRAARRREPRSVSP